MGATSNKGGYGGPNTRGPGGQGRDYNGNAIGSNMPGQFAIGGAPRPIGGPAPIPGGRPAPGDLYNRQPPVDGPRYDGPYTDENGDQMGGLNVGGPPPSAPVNRFMPGVGIVSPPGGRPQPGQMTGPYTRQRYPSGDPRRYANQGGVPGGGPQPGAPTPMPSPPMRGKGGGGGKGGMPGPGGPQIIGGPFRPGGGRVEFQNPPDDKNFVNGRFRDDQFGPGQFASEPEPNYSAEYGGLA
jgi:hypothetical protein